MAAMGQAAGLVILLMVVSVTGQTTSELTKALMEKEFVGILGAIETAGLLAPLQSLLSSGNKATIFAPKDNFYPYHVDTGVLKKLKDDKGFLKQVLQYHVIPGILLRKPSASFGPPYVAIAEGTSTFTTLAGFNLTVSRAGRKVTVDKSPAKFLDQIVLSNLVVHGINGLLIPPSLLEQVAVTNISCGRANQCPKPSPPATLAPPPGPSPIVPAPPPVPSAPGPAVPPSPFAPGPANSPPPALSPAVSPVAPGPAPGPGGEVTPLGPAPAPGSNNEIIEALMQARTYKNLIAAIQLLQLGPLADSLAVQGKVTILAPNDAAFAAVPSDINTQLTNLTTGQEIVRTHILNVYITIDQIKPIQPQLPAQYPSINSQSTPLFFSADTVGFSKTPDNSSAHFVNPPTILNDPIKQISVLGIDKILLQQFLPAPAPTSTGARFLPKLAVSCLALLGGLLAL